MKMQKTGDHNTNPPDTGVNDLVYVPLNFSGSLSM